MMDDPCNRASGVFFSVSMPDLSADGGGFSAVHRHTSKEAAPLPRRSQLFGTAFSVEKMSGPLDRNHLNLWKL